MTEQSEVADLIEVSHPHLKSCPLDGVKENLWNVTLTALWNSLVPYLVFDTLDRVAYFNYYDV